MGNMGAHLTRVPLGLHGLQEHTIADYFDPYTKAVLSWGLGFGLHGWARGLGLRLSSGLEFKLSHA